MHLRFNLIQQTFGERLPWASHREGNRRRWPLLSLRPWTGGQRPRLACPEADAAALGGHVDEEVQGENGAEDASRADVLGWASESVGHSTQVSHVYPKLPNPTWKESTLPPD